MDEDNRVFVKILEEPAPKALRFRYECEGRSAGSLPGANSTHDRKTFPKIQVMGYQGRAVVVVSCVTVDPPYRPHPHNLVGKEGCKKGVCTLEISNEDMTCEFSNLGIQCVKKKDIEDSLRIREEIRVDPFRTGFSHKTQPGSIDLNSVRLCFQVFLQGPERGQFKIPVKPVVSEPIYDKKAISDLTIMKLSDCTSTVMGNKEIILLCDKVSKDDIEVRFFEENSDGILIWEAFGDFQPSDVHKQYAISFRTPQYHQLEIDAPKRVQVQLRCPSKDTTSIPRPFDYIPVHQGKFNLKMYNLLNSVDSAHNVFEDNKMEEESVVDDGPVNGSSNLENVFENEDAYKVLNEFLATVGPPDVTSVEQSNNVTLNSSASMEEDFYGSFELAMKNPVIDAHDQMTISPALIEAADKLLNNGYLNNGANTGSTLGNLNINDGIGTVGDTDLRLSPLGQSNEVTNNNDNERTNLQRNPNEPPPRPPKTKPILNRNESPPPPIPKRSKKGKESFFKTLFSPSKSPKTSPTKSNKNKNGSKPTSPVKRSSSNVSQLTAHPLEQEAVKRKRRDISNSIAMVGYVNNVMQPHDPIEHLQLQQPQQSNQQPMMGFPSPHQEYKPIGMQQHLVGHLPMQEEFVRTYVTPSGTSGGTVLGHSSGLASTHNNYVQEPSNIDNISLPNLSDVNLSLLSDFEKSQNLENNLSENISGLSLFDDTHQVLGSNL